MAAGGEPWEPYFGLTFAPVIASGSSSGTEFDITDPLIDNDDVFNPETVASPNTRPTSSRSTSTTS